MRRTKVKATYGSALLVMAMLSVMLAPTGKADSQDDSFLHRLGQIPINSTAGAAGLVAAGRSACRALQAGYSIPDVTRFIAESAQHNETAVEGVPGVLYYGARPGLGFTNTAASVVVYAAVDAYCPNY